MPIQPLDKLPDNSLVFIDANIFVYALTRQSAQCYQLLNRCSGNEVTGVTLLETVNEATHRLMLAEACFKGLISKESAASLRKKAQVIPSLTEYWQDTEKILAFNLVFLPLTESLIRAAQIERQSFGLLTNDSMIVACMRQQGVLAIATCDSDFEQVSGISVFQPDDLP
jgi:predicted nucleic acid-binding protein